MPKQQPIDLDSALRSRLEPGEVVVWRGGPDPEEMARRSFPRSVVGLFGSFLVLLWIYEIARGLLDHADNAGFQALSFLLIGLPFVVFCGVLLLAPLSGRTAALRTLYCVTDLRVLLMRGVGEGNLRVVTPEDIPEVIIASRHGDVADIVFVPVGQTRPDGSPVLRAAFQAIRNPDSVADHLRRMAGIADAGSD